MLGAFRVPILVFLFIWAAFPILVQASGHIMTWTCRRLNFCQSSPRPHASFWRCPFSIEWISWILVHGSDNFLVFHRRSNNHQFVFSCAIVQICMCRCCDHRIYFRGKGNVVFCSAHISWTLEFNTMTVNDVTLNRPKNLFELQCHLLNLSVETLPFRDGESPLRFLSPFGLLPSWSGFPEFVVSLHNFAGPSATRNTKSPFLWVIKTSFAFHLPRYISDASIFSNSSISAIRVSHFQIPPAIKACPRKLPGNTFLPNWWILAWSLADVGRYSTCTPNGTTSSFFEWFTKSSLIWSFPICQEVLNISQIAIAFHKSWPPLADVPSFTRRTARSAIPFVSARWGVDVLRFHDKILHRLYQILRNFPCKWLHASYSAPRTFASSFVFPEKFPACMLVRRVVTGSDEVPDSPESNLTDPLVSMCKTSCCWKMMTILVRQEVRSCPFNPLTGISVFWAKLTRR